MVFLEDRLEWTFLSVVAEFNCGNIEWNCTQSFRLEQYALRGNKIEFGIRVNELLDKPRTRHSVDLDVLACDPLHVRTLHFPGPAARAREARKQEDALLNSK